MNGERGLKGRYRRVYNKYLNKLPSSFVKAILRMHLFLARIRKQYAAWKYARPVRVRPTDLSEPVPRASYEGEGKLGYPFTPVESWPPTKALVYVYRYQLLAGFVYPITVLVNGRKLVKLRHGAYYPFYADSGHVQLRTKTQTKRPKSMTVRVKAGGIYYFRATGFVLGDAPFTKLSQEQAEAELSQCYMVPEKDVARRN